MKVEVNIDLSDIFDENGDEYSMSVSELIKGDIQYEVKRQIWNNIEPEINKQIHETVSDQVQKFLIAKIKRKVNSIIKKGKFQQNRYNDEVTMETYIQLFFEEAMNEYSPKGDLRNIASALAEEMKERYDLAFAAQLVSKMTAQGLVNKEVSKVLIDKP